MCTLDERLDLHGSKCDLNVLSKISALRHNNYLIYFTTMSKYRKAGVNYPIGSICPQNHVTYTLHKFGPSNPDQLVLFKFPCKSASKYSARYL